MKSIVKALANNPLATRPVEVSIDDYVALVDSVVRDPAPDLRADVAHVDSARKSAAEHSGQGGTVAPVAGQLMALITHSVNRGEYRAAIVRHAAGEPDPEPVTVFDADLQAEIDRAKKAADAKAEAKAKAEAEASSKGDAKK